MLHRRRGGEREIEKTCPRCGYQRTHCQCGRDINHDGRGAKAKQVGRRNTSGDLVRYSSYEDWSKEPEDFSRTSRIHRATREERKFMEELLPVQDERLATYFERSRLARNALIEYSMHRHLYGTSKTWPCHTQSRYCPVCTLCQEVQIGTSILQSLLETHPELIKDTIQIEKEYGNDGILLETSIKVAHLGSTRQ
jgi:hypothetical protein